MLKHVKGLHRHIQKELTLFDISTLDDAYAKARYVEAKGSWLKGTSKEGASNNSFKNKGGQTPEAPKTAFHTINKGLGRESHTNTHKYI